MNESQLANRWAAILTPDPEITYSALATGALNQLQLMAIGESLNQMHASGFYSLTMPEPSIEDIVNAARRFRTQRQLRVLTIDYLGRLNNLYEEWIDSFTQCPVLIVPSDSLNLVSSDENISQVVNAIQEKLSGKTEMRL